MGTLILVDDKSIHTTEILGLSDIPTRYMGDYSLMGFVVDRYGDSVRILEGAGYLLKTQVHGATVCFDGAIEIARMYRLLDEHGIVTVYRDIAETFYQA